MKKHTPPKTNMEPQKLVVCRCFSFSKAVFSGSMLVFGGVCILSRFFGGLNHNTNTGSTRLFVKSSLHGTKP